MQVLDLIWRRIWAVRDQCAWIGFGGRRLLPGIGPQKKIVVNASRRVRDAQGAANVALSSRGRGAPNP